MSPCRAAISISVAAVNDSPPRFPDGEKKTRKRTDGETRDAAGKERRGRGEETSADKHLNSELLTNYARLGLRL